MKMRPILCFILFFLGLWCFIQKGYSQGSPAFSMPGEQLLDIGYVIEDFQVNENVGRSGHSDAVIAIDVNGNVILAWPDFRSGDADVYYQRFNSNGVAQGVNIRVNDDDGSAEQSEVTIGVDGAGGFIIAWKDRRDEDRWAVYCQRFDSDGTRLGGNLKLSESATVSDPDIAVGGNGRFAAVWDSPDGISSRLFDTNGDPVSEEFIVSDSETGSRGAPVAGMDGDGNCFFAWEDKRNGNTDIYGQRCDFNGTLLNGNFRVNSDEGTAIQYRPSVAVNGNSDVVVIWKDNRTIRGDLFGQRYDGQGERQGDNFQVYPATSGSPNYPSVDIDDLGRFVVSWRNQKKIYFRRFGSNGSPQGGRIQVNDWAPPGSWSTWWTEPSVGMNGSGQVVATWYDSREGNRDIYYRRFNNADQAMGGSIRVNDDEGSSDQLFSDVTVHETGKFVIAWQDEREGDADIYFQQYNAGATPFGNNVKATTDQGDEPTVYQDNANIGMDGQGRFVIGYQWNLSMFDDARLLRFDANGSQLGNKIDLPAFFDYDEQFAPVVAVRTGGDYVVAWSELEAYGTNSDVIFLRYDNGGNPVENVTRVNDDLGKENQGNPAIAMDTNGNFIITWADSRDGDYDIYFQRYTSTGSTNGNNTQVNDDDSGDPSTSHYPAIAVDGSGRFTIAWVDDRDGEWDIYARQYDAGGQALGDMFRVNGVDNTVDQSTPAIAVDVNGRVIVAWGDERDGDWDIYGQQVNDGVLIARNFRIDNDQSGADQRWPSVAIYGQVLISTWTDERVPLQRQDIFANQIDLTTMLAGTVATPTFSPEPGTYPSSQYVSISCATPGAVIYYTTDWTDPTESSTMYTGPILISQSTAVKARVYKDGWSESNVSTGRYIIGGEAQVNFQRVTDGVMVSDSEFSLGVQWPDYNSDGYPDLFVVNYQQTNSLYVNNGDGTYAKETSVAPVTSIENSRSAAWGDYNNDGHIDLFVLNHPDKSSLYENNGYGAFIKETTGPVVTDEGNGRGCAWGDYNNDGHLDLIVVNDSYYGYPHYLYHNNNGSTFTQMTNQAGLDTWSKGTDATWADVNNDRSPDLYIVNSSNNQLFYMNNQNGSFTKVTDDPIVQDMGYAYGSSWGDYNNDGFLDVFVCTYGSTNANDNVLLHNDGDGSFSKITSNFIAQDGGRSLGSAWGDYDNDGDLDLFVSNYDDVNFLYENRGDGSFDKITQGSIVTESSKSYGCAWGDYDNDGDLDLYVTNRTIANYLYRNSGNSNHWINLTCVGTISNRSAIGARVKVKTGNKWQVREISSRTGRNSQNDLRAHFGLGDAATVERITVDWPSGQSDTYTNVPADQFLILTEGQSTNTVAVPGFNPSPGTYPTPQTVSISCATPGAAIYYTTDGSTPTEASMPYGDPLNIASTTTLKAKAFLSGWTPSDVATGTYTIIVSNQIPIRATGSNLLAPGGTFWIDIQVGEHGAEVSDLFGISFSLRYSQTDYLDVQTPHSSFVLPGSFMGSDLVFYQNVDENNGQVNVGVSRKSGHYGVEGSGSVARIGFQTDVNIPVDTQIDFTLHDIKAISSDGGSVTLTPQPFSAVIQGKVAEPAFNPAPGTYTAPVTVTLSCATPEAVIHYTQDGTDPSESSTQYTSPVLLSETTTIRARAYKTGLTPSDISSGTYNFGSSTVTVSGTVMDYYGADPMDDVNLSVTGDVTDQVVSNSNGQYDIASIPSGSNVEVTPSKSSYFFLPSNRVYSPLTDNQAAQIFVGSLYGDASGNDEVRSYDASVILRVIVGLTSWINDVRDVIAADVTGDGNVTSFDASYILRYVAGLISIFPVESNGMFKPDLPVYTTGSPRIKSEIPMLQQDESVTVPVSLENAEHIHSADIVIKYNSSQLKFKNLLAADCGSHFQKVHRHSDGEIQFAMAGSEPLGSSGQIFNLVFHVSRSYQSLNETPSVVVESIDVDDGSITVEIIQNTTTIPARYILHQNHPNPFNGQTVIRYDIPPLAESGINTPVVLRVVNMMGHEVTTLVNEIQGPGSYTVHWDGVDFRDLSVPSGVYFYILRVGDFTDKKKMVLLQ